MRVRAFTGGGFAQNGYLVVSEASGEGVAVDPGAAADAMAETLEREGIRLAAILLTHAHLDHVEGVGRIRSTAPHAPIWLHPADRGLYEAVAEQARAFGLRVDPQPPPDRDFRPPERLDVGGCAFEVRFAPGHAPGHVILWARDEGWALVGDVIFQRSIGRTDLPGGDFYTLMRSIREQVLTLPDDTVLYPGHGPSTTVAEEREGNPFLIPQYGGELA